MLVDFQRINRRYIAENKRLFITTAVQISNHIGVNHSKREFDHSVPVCTELKNA
jgi:hypothetical protein